jgi:hypothetical protein
MTHEEKRDVVHKVLQHAMKIINETTGEAPVVGIFAVQFQQPVDGFAGFVLAGDVEVPLALKVVDALGTKIAAEIRAAKVKLNTVRLSGGGSPPQRH